MKRIEADGVDSLIVVPLYPHYSLSTSGSSLKLLQKYFARCLSERIVMYRNIT
jgi:ferrochelatase